MSLHACWWRVADDELEASVCLLGSPEFGPLYMPMSNHLAVLSLLADSVTNLSKSLVWLILRNAFHSVCVSCNQWILYLGRSLTSVACNHKPARLLSLILPVRRATRLFATRCYCRTVNLEEKWQAISTLLGRSFLISGMYNVPSNSMGKLIIMQPVKLSAFMVSMRRRHVDKRLPLGIFLALLCRSSVISISHVWRLSCGVYFSVFYHVLRIADYFPLILWNSNIF